MTSGFDFAYHTCQFFPNDAANLFFDSIANKYYFLVIFNPYVIAFYRAMTEGKNSSPLTWRC